MSTKTVAYSQQKSAKYNLMKYADPQFEYMTNLWNFCKLCFEGELAIKAHADEYIPRPKSKQGDKQAKAWKAYRSRHWCSDGTVDQLYLALRLAVARELLPHAPLVLDDAMVRFDNDRLEAALAILKLEAKHKQVIIFTCHGREQQLLEKTKRVR